VFLAANLGEVPVERSLREAMSLAHQHVWIIGPRSRQALAWEVLGGDAPTITEKDGRPPHPTPYIRVMPPPQHRLPVLGNRGTQYPNEVGRRILLELAASRRLRA